MYLETWFDTSSTFLDAFVFMFFALIAYFRVLRVSSKLDAAGEMFDIMTVLQLPHIESLV